MKELTDEQKEELNSLIKHSLIPVIEDELPYADTDVLDEESETYMDEYVTRQNQLKDLCIAYIKERL